MCDAERRRAPRRASARRSRAGRRGSRRAGASRRGPLTRRRRGTGTAAGRRGGPRRRRSGCSSASHWVMRRVFAGVEPSPSITVTSSWPSATTASSRAHAATAIDSAIDRTPVLGEPDPVALAHLADRRRRVAHRAGHLGGDDVRTTRRPSPRRSPRRWRRGRRRAARRSPPRCDAGRARRATGTLGDLGHLLGDRDDVLVVGQEHDLGAARRRARRRGARRSTGSSTGRP